MMENEKRGAIARKPKVVIDYGKKKGRSDGLIASYRLARKRMKKYFKKIFLHLIDVMYLKSCIFKKINGK